MLDTEPPPSPYIATRFRRTPLPGFALSALAVGFMSGAFVGMAATLAHVTPPTVAERCGASADYIGCVIEFVGRT